MNFFDSKKNFFEDGLGFCVNVVGRNREFLNCDWFC